jgi:hypothetical protein
LGKAAQSWRTKGVLDETSKKLGNTSAQHHGVPHLKQLGSDEPGREGWVPDQRVRWRKAAIRND